MDFSENITTLFQYWVVYLMVTLFQCQCRFSHLNWTSNGRMKFFKGIFPVIFTFLVSLIWVGKLWSSVSISQLHWSIEPLIKCTLSAIQIYDVKMLIRPLASITSSTIHVHRIHSYRRLDYAIVVYLCFFFFISSRVIRSIMLSWLFKYFILMTQNLANN